jgi:hypothetical protein
MNTAPPAQKTGTNALRNDSAPLHKRFPLLGQPLSAKWMSGTMGDSRVPGPSTYWIDAIVRLPAEQAATLRHQYALKTTAASTAPDLAPGLREHLPRPPWEAGDALNSALSQQGWSVKAYLSADDLVLTALGE